MSSKKIIYFLIESSYPDDSDDDDLLSASSLNQSIISLSSDIFIENIYDNETDELFEPLMKYLMTGCRKERVENYLNVVKAWTDAEFKENFRLPRTTAYHLINELETSTFIPKNTFGMKPITAEISFLIFLWFIANTEPLRTISNLFDISISSTYRVIRRVITWILTKLDDVIKWPQTNRAVINTCEGFFAKKNLSNILGAIDCTHIRIVKPSEDAVDYCNRKKYFSINLQAVVDSNMKFTNIYCGEPGSFHDAQVFRRSPLYEESHNNKENVFPNNTFLIGDSAYPSLSWLVPPFRDNGHLTPQQREFNYLHSSTRMSVEKAFGLLKSRFRRIKFFTEYRDLSFVSEVVTAACILHNYCIDVHDNFDNYEDNNIHVGINLEEHSYEEQYQNNNNDRDCRMTLFRELFPDAQVA
ncbi:putative nuclease HARBI1 [Cotesia glomerata]|uniref:putative nuclease HARBI1 n=1 Tax=Cotesia glomerata TaxID=32391 RepID=UPI001D002903|nr:putative nuclease HARBI1 [Cotesia glomerata]